MGGFDLKDIVLSFAIVGMVIAFTLLVLSEVQEKVYDAGGGGLVGNLTEAYNATGDTIDAVAEFPGWLGLLAIVIIAAIILGVLISAFRNTTGSNV